MTEEEWLVCHDPWKMLAFLRDKTSDRKLRLFAVACCRWLWHELTDDRSRQAIEVAERFADGKASKGELTRVWEAAGEVSPSGHGAAARHHRWHQAHTAAWRVAASAACNAARIVLPTYSTPGDPSPAKEIVLLRDLFGDLFRLFAINQRWLTSEVVAVANGIYDDRAFECLPVLADALEDAGCSDTDILSPLHSPDPHVRGCWALDLILGKQ